MTAGPGIVPRSQRPRAGSRACAVLTALAVVVVGCEGRDAMRQQPRVDPLGVSAFFADGAGSRPLPAGTVPRGGPVREYLPAAQVLADRPKLSVELLARGQGRFNIFCSPCHGRDGYGQGMVVQRGFPQAASYHTDDLRSVSDEHVFTVMTDGYRNMPAYGALIPVEDRWAIVAYVRALQLSQNARVEDVPVAEQRLLVE